MSLISVRNLGLPFTKRWQLFSLMLVVLLFTLLRVTMGSNASVGFGSTGYNGVQYNSGALGGFTNPTANAAVARGYQEPPVQAPVPQAPAAAPVVVQATAVQQNNTETNVFQDIFGGGQQQAKPDPAAEARKKSGLDDIEKSLGLR